MDGVVNPLPEWERDIYTPKKIEPFPAVVDLPG